MTLFFTFRTATLGGAAGAGAAGATPAGAGECGERSNVSTSQLKINTKWRALRTTRTNQFCDQIGLASTFLGINVYTFTSLIIGSVSRATMHID